MTLSAHIQRQQVRSLLLATGVFLAMLGLTGCKTGKSGNRFAADTNLVRIYQAGMEHNDTLLMSLIFDVKKPLAHREAALLAYANYATDETQALLIYLDKDTNSAMRSAGAYVLGQSHNPKMASSLLLWLGEEQNPSVKRHILEALGKVVPQDTANNTPLKAIVIHDFPHPQIHIGRAYGIYQASMRGVTSVPGTAAMVNLLQPNMPEEARLLAATYLSRAPRIDLTVFEKVLLAAPEKESSLEVRTALLPAIGRLQTATAKAWLENYYKTAANSFEKTGVLLGLEKYPYEQVRETFKAATNVSEPEATRIKAAEYLATTADEKDLDWLKSSVESSDNWRVQLNLYSAWMRLAKDKEAVATHLRAAADKAANPYFRGWAMDILAQSPSHATTDYLYKALQNDTLALVRTFALQALEKALTTPGAVAEIEKGAYQLIAKGMLEAKGDSERFCHAVRLALASGYKPTKESADGFFVQWNTNPLPDVKVCADAIVLLAQGKPVKLDSLYNFYRPAIRKIDWAKVKATPADQRVVVETTQGNIVLQMRINDAPGAVTSFMKQVETGYYDGLYWHRVVPNWVAQTGSERGDGSNSMTYRSLSEFAPLHYKAGSVGFASDGPNTEDAQWFITYHAAPRLGGNYTLFAEVVEGMDVVEKLQVGDRILKAALVN